LRKKKKGKKGKEGSHIFSPFRTYSFLLACSRERGGGKKSRGKKKKRKSGKREEDTSLAPTARLQRSPPEREGRVEKE